MDRLPFTVDSALLRELGDRLVGQPHIALSELVKNSFDADATKVVIRLEREQIIVADNGHGMDFGEFRSFWMRVGSPHKQRQRVSRNLRRPMTGSKGIGRLAVQFLGRQLDMFTTSDRSADAELHATVDWDSAVQAGDLTKAEALYEQAARTTTFPEDDEHGTVIILSSLNHQWGIDEVLALAKEIWWLQPPFRENPGLRSKAQRDFRVELESEAEELAQSFDAQMRAYLALWHARVVGKLLPAKKALADGSRKAVLALTFDGDEEAIVTDYPIPDCQLDRAEFEIRVFDLQHRQPYGIKVGEARDYLNHYGGVHVYDGGFHLPYYGPSHDWLNIEIDHSHRLSQSKLLPEYLHVQKGLSHLPTQSRLLGVVHVDSAHERQKAGEEGREHKGQYLKIQVSRDRLVDNRAYQNLFVLVRWALDFYAMEQAKRAYRAAAEKRDVEPSTAKVRRVRTVLSEYKSQISTEAYDDLLDAVSEAVAATETEAEVRLRQAGVLGALATAGISALAYEHETTRQLHHLSNLAERLGSLVTSRTAAGQSVRSIADELRGWVKHARDTQSLFSYLLDEDNRQIGRRFRLLPLLEKVVDRLRPMIPAVSVDCERIEQSLRLPEGTYAEWTAIFQNVLLNAYNAMLDSERKRIVVSTSKRGRSRAVRVEDTGCGVEIDQADELFEPFTRRLKISQERRAMGLGGTGLGLTIVRMIAENLNCRVAFVDPSPGLATAFRLSWREIE